MPFYTWASVIVNGRVVATDYAPDAGWLIAKPDAGQGGDVAMPDAPEGGDIAAPGRCWTAPTSSTIRSHCVSR